MHPIFDQVFPDAAGFTVLSTGATLGPGVTPRKLLIWGVAGVSVHLGLGPDDPVNVTSDFAALREWGLLTWQVAAWKSSNDVIVPGSGHIDVSTQRLAGSGLGDRCRLIDDAERRAFLGRTGSNLSLIHI